MTSLRRNAFQMVAVGALSVLLAACNVSSAKMGDLVTAKEKEASKPTSAFGPNDTIYIIAPGKYLPGKVTMKLKTFAEKVEGAAPHSPVQGLEGQFDLPTDGNVTFTLSPPGSGWQNGQYMFEVTMVSSDDNIQRDKKSTVVTVSGGSNAPAAAPAAADDQAPAADNADGQEAPQN